MKKLVVGLVIISAALFMHGCDTRVITAAPTCEYAKPPVPDSYLKANDSERIVMLNMSYTAQIQLVRECNTNILLVNAKNKVTFK